VDELLGNEPIRPTLAPPLPPDLIPATRTVPILGSIPCGIPAAEYEDRLGEEFLPPDLPPGEYYYLHARGDSMEPTISDGEKVLIQVTTDVFNGRIYAVLIDHESTLKRVYRYDGRIELVPDNPKYPRQVYSSAISTFTAW
jgi:repressor LexA